MAKHEVACVLCGKMFDAEQGGHYFSKNRRYACPDCYARYEQEHMQAAKKKAIISFAWKIALALICLIVGIVNGGSTLLGGVVLALCLCGWAFAPLIIAKHKYDK